VETLQLVRAFLRWAEDWCRRAVSAGRENEPTPLPRRKIVCGQLFSL